MKRHIINIIAILLLCAFIQGCSKNQNYGREKMIASEEMNVEEEPMPSSNQSISVDYSKNLPIGRKLEKNASIRIISKEISKCRKYTDSLSARYGAYIENEEYRSNYQSYQIKLRVPSTAIDSFMSGMHGINGTIVEKNISVTDCTSEYYDNESRRKTQEAMLDRYRTMLKNTTKISDMLEVQNRIDQIQLEMDRVQGRMNVIGHNVSYSVVNITIQQERESTQQEEKSHFWHDLGEAIVTGWNIVKTILLGIVTIWPLWIIGGVTFYFWRRKKGSSLK